MALNRDEIRQRIDALECMDGVQQAISDVGDEQWQPGETLSVNVTAHGSEAVSFVHNVPPSVLIAGLRAMERELAKLADVRETVDLP